jgi:hypothetical protein
MERTIGVAIDIGNCKMCSRNNVIHAVTTHRMKGGTVRTDAPQDRVRT